ncbi:hypothetical protein BGZ81_007581 [Podila clonocystis]|nr:hypothetical protein BGZ81_007581 [Podila clonocystis]
MAEMEDIQRTLARLQHQQHQAEQQQKLQQQKLQQGQADQHHNHIEQEDVNTLQHETDGDSTTQDTEASAASAASATQLLISQAQDILMLKQHDLDNGPVTVHALQQHNHITTLDNLELIAASTTSATEEGSSSLSQGSSSMALDPPPPGSDHTDHLHQRFDKNPVIIKIRPNEWEAWLEKEKIYCRWNLVRLRSRDKPTFARGPTASEWTREYQCEHAGHYRDRKNPDIEPKKKRKRGESIKCGCTASIKMKKQFQEDEVSIEYFWKHEGHTPGVLEDIKSQRLPQDLKAWIKRRIVEGYDWKAIKGMIQNGSPLLDELLPASKQNVKQLLQACYSQYANSSRLMNKNNAQSPSSQPNQTRDDEEMPLAREGSSSSQTKERRSTSEQAESTTLTDQTQTQAQAQAWQLDLTGNSAGANSLEEVLRRRIENHDGSTLAVHTLASVSAGEPSSQAHATIPISAASNDVLLQVISDLERSTRATSNTQEQGQAIEQIAEVTQPSEAVVKAAAGLMYSTEEVQRSISSNLNATVLDGTTSVGGVDQRQRQARSELLATLRSIADLHKQMETSEQYISQEDTKQITDSFAVATRLLKEALERSSQGMVIWMGGSGGRLRVPKRMILSGSLLMMVLFYYVSLPETSMYLGRDNGEVHKGSLADDTEIVMDVGNGERNSHGWLEVKGETIGKSSKQRNYNFEDIRADAGSCGLISNDNSDSGSCAPASDKRHKELENNRFSIAEEDDVSTSETLSKDPSKVKVAWSKTQEQESIQEQDDDQGSELEDGFMMETEEERVDREEKETIAATIEAEIEREEAMFREMNKNEDEDEEEAELAQRLEDLEKSDDSHDEEQEEDGASDSEAHQLVKSLFQGDQEFAEEEEEYRKEDRLGQAGPLETMDDEE